MPLFGKLGAAPQSFVPHYREICSAAEVVRYCNGVVQIENDVPPASWDEYGLARTLQYLHLKNESER